MVHLSLQVIDILGYLGHPDKILFPLLLARIIIEFSLVVVGKELAHGYGAIDQFELARPVLSYMFEEVICCIGGSRIGLLNETFGSDFGPVEYLLIQRTGEIPLRLKVQHLRFGFLTIPGEWQLGDRGAAVVVYHALVFHELDVLVSFPRAGAPKGRSVNVRSRIPEDVGYIGSNFAARHAWVY